MKLCETCIYRNQDEYHKPCIVYRDDCEYYESEEDMSDIDLYELGKKEALQEIRQEIEKPLREERYFDTADAKAQYIALNWVCELIDKHIKEIEGSDTE